MKNKVAYVEYEVYDGSIHLMEYGHGQNGRISRLDEDIPIQGLPRLCHEDIMTIVRDSITETTVENDTSYIDSYDWIRDNDTELDMLTVTNQTTDAVYFMEV